MYRSTSRFLARPPAGSFWREYSRVFYPRQIGSAEALMSALADALKGPNPKARVDQITDYELAGVLVLLGDQGLIADPLSNGILQQIDRRLESEGEAIHFSQTDRMIFDRMLEAAADA